MAADAAARAPTASTGGTADADSIRPLARVLDRAVRELGDAGQQQRACELAAEAWALLRDIRPREGRRLEGTLHYLTRERFEPGYRGASPAHGRSQTQEEVDQGPGPDILLDVRHLAPARRHELIFETYESLRPAQAFLLVNDHDPKPLYYQFAAEHSGRFAWEPLESGPEVWRVRIAKTAQPRD